MVTKTPAPSSNPTTRVEVIGRAKAEEYLTHNAAFTYDNIGSGRTNRQLSWKTVLNYAAEMLLGEWSLTHQGIAFDEEDVLFDGQHRLHAIMMATELDSEINGIPSNPNLTVRMQVTRGANRDNFEKVDIGRNRSAAQILAMLGIKAAGPVAAACRLVYMFDNVPDVNMWRRVAVPRHTIREITETTDIVDWYSEADPLKYNGMIISPALAGIFVCHRANPDADMEEFLRLLKEARPEEMTSTNPIHVLREATIRSKLKASGPRRNPEVQFFMFIKTWNDWLDDKIRNVISWRANEGIIRPNGWKPAEDA